VTAAAGVQRDVPPGQATRRSYAELGRAVPFLVQGLRQDGTPALQDRCGKALAKLALSGPGAVRAEAKEALRCVFRGVNDQGHVLSRDACRRLNDRVSRLSRQHHLYFSARTFRQRPAEPVWNCARCVPALDGRGLSVVMCAEPPAVEVALSPDLKGKGSRLNAEELRKVLQTNLQNNTPGKGLEEAVELVERSLANDGAAPNH